MCRLARAPARTSTVALALVRASLAMQTHVETESAAVLTQATPCLVCCVQKKRPHKISELCIVVRALCSSCIAALPGARVCAIGCPRSVLDVRPCIKVCLDVGPTEQSHAMPCNAMQALVENSEMTCLQLQTWLQTNFEQFKELPANVSRQGWTRTLRDVRRLPRACAVFQQKWGTSIDFACLVAAVRSALAAWCQRGSSPQSRRRGKKGP